MDGFVKSNILSLYVIPEKTESGIQQTGSPPSRGRCLDAGARTGLDPAYAGMAIFQLFYEFIITGYT
jgi:hypothetical protein